MSHKVFMGLLVLMGVLSIGLGRAADGQAPVSMAAPATGPPAASGVPAVIAPVTDEPDEPHFLIWLHNSSGVFGYGVLVASFVMVAVIVMLSQQLRREVMIPNGFIEIYEDRLNNKDYQGAYETAKGDDSIIARMLAAGMAKLSLGYDKSIEEVKEVGDDESMFIDHKLGYLALIAAVAPMLGLLGTVQGMIYSFNEIAENNTTPKPKDLAFGISMALVTTLEGLVVAIPAMISNSLLKNRAEVLMNEIASTATHLMARLAALPKTPPKSSGGFATATPADQQD